MSTKTPKLLTVSEFAAKHDVTVAMVLTWIKAGRLAGAQKEALPFAGEKYIWRIPEDAPRPARGKPGPVRGAKTAAKKAAKKAGKK